ncbi:aspartate aminotransferase family protein [Fulvivirga sp. RKSG066]|uniref:aspartate aminotransferase family protein n=1 Tax=Fulvivirga aurantia TaxID=2529383 RepID=UPI0012BCFBB8|nr:aspartate aminotransferase family protein [Fulvivirga aurantia]MTI21664.1 aspartate aminotransferase family protein [Fulvivirga aurantia]
MQFSHDTFLKNIAQTTGSPFLINIEKAEGIYLYSPEGKRYMDLISGIAVSNLGHKHPRVIEAVKKQVDSHMHVMVYGEFVQSSPNQLAEKLVSLLPPQLNCCYFTNSGTEANEGALKLAKRYTGRTEIVSFRGAYHGSTHGSLSVSGNEVKKQAFRPLLPDVRFINFNHHADLDQITDRTACVIFEPIQGDAGVRIATQKYLEALRKKCDDTGALLIFDEIQTGVGRTGKMFAFEHYNVVPDILTSAKALGGGLPIGTFISSYEIMQTLTHEPMLGHITTFGGNPVSCAAAHATLSVIEDEGLLSKVEPKGELFESLLSHPKVKEIRRKGLMFAIEFETDEEVYKIVKYCLDHGLICFWFLSCPNSFRIAPPLTITEEEIKEACKTIQEAFDHL